MRFHLLIVAGMGILGMFGLTSRAEVLPKADGTVSATKLPFDAKMAKKNFETATFGLG